jgi:hypothetical protein
MITIDEFRNNLIVQPSSAAIDKVMRAFPHAFDCRNESQKLLLHVYAWTGGIGSEEIAQIIDDAMSEHYPDLLDSLEQIGAKESLEYAKRAAEICGGSVPSDELERAELVMKFHKEFHELDKIFNKSVQEEAAEALMKRFSENVQKSFNELAEQQNEVK